MLFINVEEFFRVAKDARRLTREEEKLYATKMMEGDTEAREILIYSYFYFVAAYIKRYAPKIQTLNSVYQFLDTLEKAVDQFDFLQDNYTFINHLSKLFRQCITRCLVCD